VDGEFYELSADTPDHVLFNMAHEMHERRLRRAEATTGFISIRASTGTTPMRVPDLDETYKEVHSARDAMRGLHVSSGSDNDELSTMETEDTFENDASCERVKSTATDKTAEARETVVQGVMELLCRDLAEFSILNRIVVHWFTLGKSKHRTVIAALQRFLVGTVSGTLRFSVFIGRSGTRHNQLRLFSDPWDNEFAIPLRFFSESVIMRVMTMVSHHRSFFGQRTLESNAISGTLYARFRFDATFQSVCLSTHLRNHITQHGLMLALAMANYQQQLPDAIVHIQTVAMSIEALHVAPMMLRSRFFDRVEVARAQDINAALTLLCSVLANSRLLASQLVSFMQQFEACMVMQASKHATPRLLGAEAIKRPTTPCAQRMLTGGGGGRNDRKHRRDGRVAIVPPNAVARKHQHRPPRVFSLC